MDLEGELCACSGTRFSLLSNENRDRFEVNSRKGEDKMRKMKPESMALIQETGLRQALGGTPDPAPAAVEAARVIQVSSSNMDAVINLIR